MLRSIQCVNPNRSRLVALPWRLASSGFIIPDIDYDQRQISDVSPPNPQT